MANSPVNDELVAETCQKLKSGRQQFWGSPTSSCASSYEDPDWSLLSLSWNSAESASSSDTHQLTKKLRLTSTDECRTRKKELNKNAAARHRTKKKVEMEEIVGEEKELMGCNDSLKSKVVEVKGKIKYLISLMGDMFRAIDLFRVIEIIVDVVAEL